MSGEMFPVISVERVEPAEVNRLLVDWQLATLRWLCNWEPETIARFVVMVQRANEEGRNHG